ncbi:Membrane protein [Mannheimia sp. USDA-ARS-USMARC-1261]|uniref:hypothetical protein n=1 Tax=Mannheimia sp. USDA-ARS-USMARC-1261 TaxID=1432056 RepID=UPI0003E39270|nr:hypothetical protein [Mannheimia sp. USDA-ARS-USMARC-1261]AHG72754.1 Membrane protein [Mannheimia sp. USDA-ARS-USMARC-1261]
MSALFNLFYIYDPWFFHFLRMAFLVGLLACGYLVSQVIKGKSNGIIIPKDSLIAIFALIGFSVIPLIINGTKEIGVLAMYVKMLILFIFGIAVYNIFYRTENGKSLFVRDLKIGIGIQWICGVAALLGVPFMVDFLLSSNAMMPRFLGSEQEYRLYNITSSAFFQLSIFYLMLLHFLLAYNKKTDSINEWFLFLILCVGLISGRTFLLISIISIALYFKWKYLLPLIAFTILILFLAIVFPENRYVEHALEPVINLLSGTGKVSSSTDNLVKNHLFIPTLSQFISGDGLYYTETGGYYGGSDSGYIRQVLYGGLSYMLVCFAFTAYFVRKVAINWFGGSWIFTLSTIGMLAILNIKADTFAYPGIMFVLLMFLSLFGTSGRNLILFCNNKEAKNV